ncbi:amidohydrolase family protein [Massilioclostridium coli]|uniref:amidohydrolase family protein n=1 Tax=Massilioclostridium coli TaxID=1870991 RepID=UPI00085BE1D9|nr:amidohydrolase family protein [Massilioclostridium coli]
MVIDVHTHIFPEHIAEKATNNIGNYYQIPIQFNGTVNQLLDNMQQYHIDKCVVNSVATNPHQVQTINQFVAEQVKNYPNQLIGFGSLHPDSENLEQDFQQLRELKLKGIKLHPDFQGRAIDDPKVMKIYEMAEGCCPILMHMGSTDSDLSSPKRLAKILDLFPKLDIIAAHFGGWSHWEDAALELALKRVYVDTSSTQYAVKPHQIRELIDIFGIHHVIFGSDYPIFNAGDELKRFENIPMTEEEKECIFHGNIERLLLKYKTNS